MHQLFADILQPALTSEPGFGENMINLLSNSYHEDIPIVHTCFLIIVICFSLTIIVTILLFMHRFWSQFHNGRRIKLEERYSLLLTGIIFDDQDEEFEAKRQKLITYFRKNYIRSRFSKKILRKELLFLHRSFSGPSQEILKGLYFELDLHKAALEQLKDTDWSEKANAVRELGQMDYEKARGKVLKLTLHENKVLRMEAQVAMLSLNDDEPFGFLAHATNEITEWQQLTLEEKAKSLDLKKIPNFSKWFGLKNQSVVQFCVKMTVAYNQFEAADELLTLLHSKDERVVKEAVKAVGTMLISEAQTTLLDIYATVAPEIKDEIIVALGKIGGEEGVAFLEELLYTAQYEFALKAGKSLYTIGFEADAILQKALQSEQPLVAAIVSHVMDERI